MSHNRHEDFASIMLTIISIDREATPQRSRNDMYVLAISTVISPVVEVFTQVNYEVKGPLDSPTVKEISRSKGE